MRSIGDLSDRIRDRGVGGLRVLFPGVRLNDANKLHLLDKVCGSDHFINDNISALFQIRTYYETPGQKA